MNSNFSANDILATCDVIMGIGTATKTLVNAAQTSPDSPTIMYDTIVSEDSNLAATWSKMNACVTDISEKASDLVNKICDELQNYASATIANESQAEETINGINNSLEEISSQLDQIEI